MTLNSPNFPSHLYILSTFENKVKETNKSETGINRQSVKLYEVLLLFSLSPSRDRLDLSTGWVVLG